LCYTDTSNASSGGYFIKLNGIRNRCKCACLSVQEYNFTETPIWVLHLDHPKKVVALGKLNPKCLGGIKNIKPDDH
jgi:hypothetical protein